MRASLTIMAAVVVLAIGQAEPTARQSSSQSPSNEKVFAGTWIADIAKSKRHPKYEFESSTLNFVFKDNSVTITGRVVFDGKERVHSETFRTDETETPASLAKGVTVSGRWVSRRILETIAKKDGERIAVATYEVAADGKTLTARTSGAASFDQVIVYERK